MIHWERKALEEATSDAAQRLYNSGADSGEVADKLGITRRHAQRLKNSGGLFPEDTTVKTGDMSMSLLCRFCLNDKSGLLTLRHFYRVCRRMLFG